MSTKMVQAYRGFAHRVRSNERLDGVNKSVSKLAFGNTAGTGNNLTGKAYRLVNRVQTNGVSRPSRSPQVKELRTNGYLKLGTILSDDEISTIQKTYDRLVEDDATSVVRGQYDDEVYSRVIRNEVLPDEMPELSTIMTDEVTDLVNGFFGAHCRPWQLQCTRNYHVPPEVVAQTETFANYWHFDQHPTFDIKLFVLVSDVDEDDGPLHVVPLNQSKRLARRGFRRDEDGVPGEVVERHADPVTFTGPAGSAMLGTTHALLHRAGNPAEGRDRDMVILRIFPDTEPCSADWLSHLQPNAMDRSGEPMYGESNGT